MPLPPLIPRSVLYGNPDRISPALSPDGSKLGFVAPDDDVLNVWVGPSDGSGPMRPVTFDRDRGVRDYTFCHDDRHLVYAQDQAGDESWRLYLMDLETGDSKLVTPEKGVQAQILKHNRWHPTQMLIGLNADNPEFHDVYRLDLPTGELTKELTNPGFAAWLIDTDLVVRGALAMTPEGGMTALRRDGDDWTPFLDVGPDDAETTGPISFSRDGATMLWTSSVGVNAGQLIRLDLANGEQTVIAADPEYDVAGVWLDPATLLPQAAVFVKERREIVLLDDSLAPDLERLRSVGDGELSVARPERSDRVWLFSLLRSDGPTGYYLYNRDTAEVRFLFHNRPALSEYDLAPMEPFSYPARDGRTIHGYVTFPPGVERRNLPGVLNVHGGPWSRDSWGLNPDAQWLANRGYVCIQVNFRGSTGYGKEFLNAGDKQWGAAMQDDLTDAVAYAVASGWVAADRVAISGGSYGGYAALAGAAFTPDIYRCAIDIVGPSNLLTLIESLPPYWRPVIAMFHKRMGDPATEKDMLWQRSPLSQVEAIRIPLLIAQGANDPRVKQAESEQIVAALTEKGLDPEYLLFEDEGHGLAKPANRERYYAAAERFLAAQLGGRSQD